jgi:hypothetical protein
LFKKKRFVIVLITFYMHDGIEIWKDVEGYEGYYQVSNLEDVRGLKRKVGCIWRGVYKEYSKPACILKPESKINQAQ